METSVLFLVHAGQIWNLDASEDMPLGFGAVSAAGDEVEGPRMQKAVTEQAAWRRKLLSRGQTVESPCDGSLVDVAGLGVSLFMAALWRLSVDGVVGLSLGETTSRRRGGTVSIGWEELPIRVSLQRKPGKERASLEGRIVEALVEGFGPDGAEVTELGRAIAKREPLNAVAISRNAAVDEGLLALCEPEEPGALVLGFGGEPRRGLMKVLGPKRVPRHVVADCAKVAKLTPEFSRQNDAYADYRRRNEGFEGLVNRDWSPLPDSGDGGGGSSG